MADDTPLHLTREAILHTAQQTARMLHDQMHTLQRSQRIITGILDDADRAAAWRAHADLVTAIIGLSTDLATLMTNYAKEIP
ncbi:MAG: hypothetical protein KGS47_16185 [Chloroflexi bacterium]|nr:hypothetical protein [Chloroflexota bacterium]